MAPTLAAKRADAAAHHRGSRPIRALIVDDSAVVRGLVSRLLAEQPDIEIAATASNGEQALKALAGARFDVVVLDVEMPVMDGLTALPKMLAIDPDVRVIIASTLSKPGAAITIRALAAGAADYIPKPSASRDLTSAATDGDGFRRDLVIKVRALGEAGRRRRDPPAPGVGSEEVAEGLGSASWPLRRTPPTRPEILVIGSSTGGPQALSTLVGGLPADLTLPILIAQHMPPHFTAILAEHLARIGRRPCAEGRDGEPIQPGRIYVAPGDFHMIVGRDGRRRVIRINQAPPENFCRPAVDALFRSAAACYGAATLAVVLTGIGADGTRGGEAVVAAAGALIAQDEASSVVWGMPGSVARAGLCSAVLPLEALVERIGHLATGPRP